eukprot:CAMPEP_0184359806 /NCGR_PEP_ID=MMETSP1089-20130417/121887_1 /TAXON_ID=38269 ORGANISM="Gloeochaete wittrockiana, Strain SAG46.84" /NCGR_SAMPLE_ID=MMETSP1089 /ASSEMBLY_ACC=CAM_ASM_000445 /LENGTH=231 /DNA_ID=CAMNT_0026698769 /DNA_START=40 /DNA_END=735 /DNA_ORIENTATION=+
MALVTAVAAATGAFLARKVQKTVTVISQVSAHPSVVFKLLNSPETYLKLTGRNVSNIEASTNGNAKTLEFSENFRGLVLSKTSLTASSTADKINNKYTFSYSYNKLGTQITEELSLSEFEDGTAIELKAAYDGRALPVSLIQASTCYDHFFGAIKSEASARSSDLEDVLAIQRLAELQQRVRYIDANHPKTLELPEFPTVTPKFDLDAHQLETVLDHEEYGPQFQKLTVPV